MKNKRRPRNRKTAAETLRENMEHIFSNKPGNDLTEASEKAWLNYILDFEEYHKNAKDVTVWEFIGKPPFVLIDKLDSASISLALDAIYEKMTSNNVLLDFCVAYPDDVIYKFITEELFQHKIQDIKIPGGNICFIYEEFHPNHDYDLRRYSSEHLECLFKPDVIRSHLSFYAMNSIYLNDKLCTKDSLADFIIDFHNLHKRAELRNHTITDLTFDLELNSGKVSVDFNCCLFFNDGGHLEKKENVTLNYLLEYDFWILKKIESSLF